MNYLLLIGKLFNLVNKNLIFIKKEKNQNNELLFLNKFHKQHLIKFVKNKKRIYFIQHMLNKTLKEKNLKKLNLLKKNQNKVQFSKKKIMKIFKEKLLAHKKNKKKIKI